MKMGCGLALGSLLLYAPAGARAASQPQAAAAAPQSTGDAAIPKKADPAVHRLILKDGTYQAVNKWEVVHNGERVRYISTERGGDWEELPITLIDWTATRAYLHQHAGQGDTAGDDPAQQDAAAIDAEEKADRSRDMEVAPNLRLPVETGIWALDTFQDQPELVELEQNTVNPQTGHNVVRSALNASGATRQNIQLNERHARPALHGAQPVFYISVDVDGAQEPGADALTVDTHGGGSQKGPEEASSAQSRYVIVHADVRKEFRFVGQVKVASPGDSNVLATRSELLPGKRWLKLTSLQPVASGDYVLMELLSSGEANMAVWDFRIDPRAGDNENAILPLKRYKIEH